MRNIIGNVNFCLGLKFDDTQGYYVPASSLLEDIKVLTDMPSQVLAIFSKVDGEELYEHVRHVSKGINLNNVKLPKEIEDKICLESYVPKVCKKSI